MSHATFRCPACKVTLTPPKLIPAGTRLVCPYCDSRFSVPLELSLSTPFHRGARRSVREIKWTKTALIRQSQAPGVKTKPMTVMPSTDLKMLHRRFAMVLVGTVLILNAIFGTALYLVAKDGAKERAKYQAALVAKAADAQAQERQSLQAAQEKEGEKRRQDFRQHMIQGGVALGNHRFEEAINEYQASLRLYPEDVEAAKGLSAARAELEKLAAAENEEEKRQAEFTRLVNLGQEAMKNQRFADAARAFDNALRLRPGNAAVARAFHDAVSAEESKLIAKKKTADYEFHMSAARAAMAGQRYRDALADFLAALQLNPNDAGAMAGRKLAEARLNELQDMDNRRADFNHFMDQGDRALQNHRFEEAERAYTKAVALMPRDLDAREGLKEAQKGLEKVKQDFLRLMGQGDLAMQSGRFGDAVRAFSQAAKLIPTNDGANEKLQAAQKSLDDQINAQAAYNRLVSQSATTVGLSPFGDTWWGYSTFWRWPSRGWWDARADFHRARARSFWNPHFGPIFH
jgi:cytochrome c-type biogenesis protein CcmH/NrfG